MKDREFLLWLHGKLEAAGLFNRQTRARLKRIAERTSPRQNTYVPPMESEAEKLRHLHSWK